MKKIGIAILSVLVVGGALAFTVGSEILEIGTTAPMADVKMKDVSGKSFSLNDAKKDKGLLVLFSCNTCPFVVGSPGYGTGWEGRYNELNDYAARMGVGTIIINSNEGKRSGDDSFDAMKKHAAEKGYKSHYVMDENHALADAFGAKTTPHAFLFDENMQLVYKGAIDDNNEDAGKVTQPWLKNALSAVGKGGTIDPNSTRQKGCSIKRVKK